MPALLTRMSTAPQAVATVAAASCTLKVISSATTVPQLKWTPSNDRYDHFDTHDFIPVDKGTQFTVTTANAKTPIVIAGDLSAEGMEELEVRIDREVNVSLTALSCSVSMEIVIGPTFWNALVKGSW